jgi:uncharacterized protein with HEPN domain
MSRTDEAFAGDILKAASSISDYTSGVTKDNFLGNGIQNAIVRDAVIRQISIIGEAASKLSDAFCDMYPRIPWHQIVGMRQIVIHHYWKLDLDVVWEVATKDIPALVRQLKPPPLVQQSRSRRPVARRRY